MDRKYLPKASIFTGSFAYHSFFTTISRLLYAIGKNSHGQLGLGDSINRSEATRVSFFDMIPIKSIACGSGHTIFLTEAMEIYSCGNNLNGELGLGNNKCMTTPHKIDFMDGKEVIEVACGANSSYCLTKHGLVYSFGYRARHGPFVLGIGSVSSPDLVPFPAGVKIARISAGYGHVAALGMRGDVYTFGYDHNGELGRAGDSRIPGKFNIENKKVEQIACGEHYTCVVCSENEVYSFGNYNEQFTSGVRDYRNNLKRMQFFDANPIKCMHVGGSHLICTLKTGKIVGLGFNGYRQLISEANLYVDAPVEIGTTEEILDIVCGCSHTLILKRDLACYGRGFREAFGKDVNVETPIEISSNVEYKALEFPPDILTYILREQAIGGVTTDAVIEIQDYEAVHKIHVNESFIREWGIRDDILKCRKFTNGMKQQLIKYIYGSIVEVDAMDLDDVVMLHALLSRYHISENLRCACRDRIWMALNNEKAGVRVFSIAEETGDEYIVNVSLRIIGSNYLSYAKEVLEKGEEFTLMLTRMLAHFSVHRTERRDSSPVNNCIDYLECLRRLYQKKEAQGDMEIRSGNSVHKAHKFVLVARKEYFRAMLYGGFSEGVEGVIHLEMELGDVFETFLRYLYTGDVNVRPEDCSSLLSYLDYFGIDSEADFLFKKYCEGRAGVMRGS